MTALDQTASVPDTMVRRLISRGLALVSAVPDGLIALIARVGIAGIFWRSGQTKVHGFDVTESALYLFREEYQVPLLSPEVAAHLAAFAEHFFPVLLVLGLASRLSALALLGMTAVIQLFVYPDLWPDHAVWATALLIIIARGPGGLSLDRVIAMRFSH